MPRSLKVRRPGAADIRRLQATLDDFSQPRQRRRAEAILLHTAGLEATTIAQALAAHPNTIRADLHAFDRDGLRVVQAAGSRPATRGFTPEQIAALCRLAETAPIELGLPWGRWSLSKLRDYLLAERLPPPEPRAPAPPAPERGLHFARVRRKIISSDPQRRAILSRLRLV